MGYSASSSRTDSQRLIFVKVLKNLNPDTERKICDCLRQVADISSVEKIIIFGSRAKGSSREDSDLDVAVFFNLDESKMLECYRKLVRICSIPDVDIQIQAFSASELENPCGIIEEIVKYGFVYHCP